MANFETEVYELLKLFDSPGNKHDEKISNYCSSTPSWSKLTILPHDSSRVSQFFTVVES